MAWNIEIYEEPGILMVQQVAVSEGPPTTAAQGMMSEGLEQGRVLLALMNIAGDTSSAPILYPEPPAVDTPFEELVQEATDLLSDQRPFAAVNLLHGALRGAGANDPEVQMLAASIFEHVRFYTLAIPCLEKALEGFDGVTEAAAKIRLARALRKSGRAESVKSILDEARKHPELPPVLQAEALLVLAMEQEGEEAIDTLDDLLDIGEEHIGDHRLVAEALEMQADLHKQSDPARAEKFYLAAGKMLIELKDPYFFALNERLVVFFIQQEKWEEALGLSQEMFQMLQATQAPYDAHVPFFIFASHVHEQLGDKETSDKAKQAARDINPVEASRIQGLLKQALASGASEVAVS